MGIGIKKINDYTWEVSRSGDMLVPARIYTDAKGIKELTCELDKKGPGTFTPALTQVINVATLPGITRASLAMADIHPGYGFAIGGVGAFDMDSGVISVAGVGFDINCGVRVLKTPFVKKDIEEKKIKLADRLFRDVPCGIGSKGRLELNEKEINKLLKKGAAYMVSHGYGTERDLEYTEENGRVEGADPGAVSQRAKQRQFKQVGTLGSGNHYLEVQYIEEIFDAEAAAAYGLYEGQVLISIHCGSRALGHQIGTDYLKKLEAASRKYAIPIKERELVCAPIHSPEGQQYLSAVNAGINCAFANRHVISHLARKAVSTIMGIDTEEMELLYDVAHNTCKVETHEVEGESKELLVHRKGATRAFGPGRIEVPEAYRQIGQPLLVGGSMGTASYILRGTETGMKECFGSAVHGAGRALSRMKAKKRWRGTEVIKELLERGIIIRARSQPGVAEEAPGAYKDVDRVVDIMHRAGVNEKVARLRPIACIKG